jgi:hypothetical protein
MLSSLLEREWAMVCAVAIERAGRTGESFVLVTNGMSTHEREEYQQRSNKISKKSRLTSMSVGPRQRAIVVRAGAHDCAA